MPCDHAYVVTYRNLHSLEGSGPAAFVTQQETGALGQGSTWAGPLASKGQHGFSEPPSGSSPALPSAPKLKLSQPCVFEQLHIPCLSPGCPDKELAPSPHLLPKTKTSLSTSETWGKWNSLEMVLQNGFRWSPSEQGQNLAGSPVLPQSHLCLHSLPCSVGRDHKW